MVDSSTFEEMNRLDGWEDFCERLEIRFDDLSRETQPGKCQLFDKLYETLQEEVPQILQWRNEIRDGKFLILNHVRGNIDRGGGGGVIPLDVVVDLNDENSKTFYYYVHENFSKLWSLYRKRVLIQLRNKRPTHVTAVKNNSSDDYDDYERKPSKYIRPYRDYLDFVRVYNKPIQVDNNNSNSSMIVSLLELMNTWDLGLVVSYSSRDQSFELADVTGLPRNNDDLLASNDIVYVSE